MRLYVRLLLPLMVFTLSVPLAVTLPTSAVTASDWKSGRIIDDSIFTNQNDMSVNDVQAFLNSKVPSCDTNGTKPASEYGRPDITHAQYAALRGWAGPPYICLRDYYEVPKTSPSTDIPANNFGGSIPGGAVSAAQLIYNAAQQYQINPKVLLVMIQKESPGPLTTDTWPLASQYRYALGAHCPDSTGCDSNYAGFSIQILESAKLLRGYIDNMTQPWWQYRKPYQTNSILFNPTTSCGSSGVYIESKATAALYTYTPYQPNQAALNNMYGTGDSCSAYGNRNFWRIYSDWFGTTYAPSYAWGLESQELFADAQKNTGIDVSNIAPGQKMLAVIRARNTGNVNWSKTGANPIMVGTSQPLERNSAFSANSSWLSPTRPALLKEATVAPGQTGTFEFWLTAPSEPGKGGIYREYFNLIANNLTWFNNIGLFYSMNVQPARYTWSMASQYAYTDETKTTVANMNNLLPGQRVYVGVTAKNTGNMTWQNTGANALMIGTASPIERSSKFSAGSSWLTGTRPALLKEATVAPGQTGTFEFWLTIPPSGVSGIFNERFSLIANNLTWLNDVGLSYYMNVQPARYTWSMASQYAYTDETKTTVANMNNLLPGQRVYVGVTAKNTGNMTWQNTGANALMIGTASPIERSSKFSAGSSWLTGTRPALLKEATVAPGQTGTFEFWLTIPPSGVSGIFNERFSLIANNLTWLNDVGLSYYMNVQR